MSILGQILANTAQPQVQKQEKNAIPAGAKKAASNTTSSTASSTSQTTKAAPPSAAASAKADSLVRGEVIDLRPNQVLVRLENGTQLSARLEGSIALYIGQKADFFVSQTTDSLITLKLAPNSSANDPVTDKILQAANLQKNDRTVTIVNELLAHQQPVTGANIRHYLMLSSKYPDLPVKDLILMELHQIPVSEETTARFAEYRADSHRLLAQGTTLLNILSEQISSLPDTTKQMAFIKELQTILRPFTEGAPSSGAPDNTVMQDGSAQTEGQPLPSATDGSSLGSLDNLSSEGFMINKGSMAAEAPLGRNAFSEGATPPDSSEGAGLSASATAGSSSQAASAENSPNTLGGPSAGMDRVSADNTEYRNPAAFMQEQTYQASAEAPALTASVPSASSAETALLTESPSRLLSDLKQKFLNSFLLSPKQIAENGKISDYYEKLNEQLAGLEQLAEKLSKSTGTDTAQAPAKQLRSNLSFMDMVNQVFPYVQLPLQLKEHPAHGELYVYEKKRSLSDSGSLSALLHLELEALGTTDIFVTLTASNVAARFYLADETAKSLVTTELPSLQEALERQGYSLQTEVTVREDHPEDDSLLEQFLEEHSPSELHRYTFDIRA